MLKARVAKLEQPQNNTIHELGNCTLHDTSSDIPFNIRAHPFKSKSLEDIETDDFLNAPNKKDFSNMMRKRNREKKLQTQDPHNASLSMSTPSEVSAPPISNENNSSEFITGRANTEVPESPDSKTVKRLAQEKGNREYRSSNSQNNNK